MNLIENASSRSASIAVATVLLLGLVGAAATRTSFAATSNSGIVIPLYTYPTDGSWSASLQAKNAHPNVPIIAIINPSDGPGGASDSNYVQGVKNFQAAGIIVIGYVATGYASHGMSDLDAQISRYKNWYSVNGIFFDEMANNQGNENYYSTLNTYVKSLGMTMTMGNPGTSVPSSYIGTLDSLCIFEQGGLPTLSYLSSYSGHPKSNFAYIGLSVSSLNTSYEVSSSNYVQWIYITDAGGGSPYDVLPSYFMNEVAALDAGTQSSTSTSTTTSRTTTTTTATGTTATLSISTADSSNQPVNGFYIQEVKDNTAGTSTGGTYTPQTVGAVVGHSYSVTVDDYATRYVQGANIGTFARNVVVPQSGTTTFTLQGDTNLVFTEALLATSSSTSTTTTTPKTTTTATTSPITTTSKTTTTTSPITSTSKTTTITSTTATTTTSSTGTLTSTTSRSTRATTTSTTTETDRTPRPDGPATLYPDIFKAVDLFGLPVGGATVKVTAANGTQITKPTDGDGVASFNLPNGTYSADLTYMGVTSSVSDQTSGPHSITVTFILGFPILVLASLFAGTLAAVVVGRRWRRGKADLGPATL